MKVKLPQSKSHSAKKAFKKIPAKKKNTPVQLLIYAFLLLVIFIIIYGVGNQFFHFQSNATATSWVDNDRSLAKQSAWFTLHEYSDCPDTSLNYWPTDEGDCLIDEPDTGPRADDQLIAQDPPGLYYKHFLPTDFYNAIPTLLYNLDFTTLTQKGLSDALKNAVIADPNAFSMLSVDSFYLGLVGSNSGTIVRSSSLMVHPDLERPISSAIGVLQRAKNLYKPFIEGSTGAGISDSDLQDLYVAAMNKCGANAINGDQSGHGVYKIVGEYAVIVQNWNDPKDLDLTQTDDCNIHVVKLSATSGTPQPTNIIPTFVCLGTSCVPSVTPTVAIAQPSLSPTLGVVQTPTPSTTPKNHRGGNGRGGFFQSILDFLSQFLSFFSQLFK